MKNLMVVMSLLSASSVVAGEALAPGSSIDSPHLTVTAVMAGVGYAVGGAGGAVTGTVAASAVFGFTTVMQLLNARRDQALLLQEDAKEFLETGVSSPALEELFTEIQEQDASARVEEHTIALAVLSL